jgi:glucose/arabinose dehydrogenase
VLHHHFVKAARRRSRFQLAALVTALALIGGAGPAAGSATRPASDAAAAPAAFNPGAINNLVLTQVASGLSRPVLVTHAGDGSGRLFVVEQTGKIRVIKGGVLLPDPLISVAPSIVTSGEQGLLGLAFHPQFESNGKFYVYFTLKNGNNAVNEYRVDPPFTGDTARWQTGRRIMTISHPTYTNHNGGHLAFGRDNHLYIGTGDGGSSGDPFNRAQNLNSFLGKILRINPNLTVGSRNYAIPRTNPYVRKTGLDEIWARGLRNPWRFSFDRATWDLWIGDVGQNRYEEIDVSRTTFAHNSGWGANYGWRIMEGRACFNPSRCSTAGKVRPVAVYSHSFGCSVTGGYVSRGPDPLLLGGYLYADFCSGRIWGLDAAAAAPTPVQLRDTSLMISSFGEDEAGNLYVVDHGGAIFRVSAN